MKHYKKFQIRIQMISGESFTVSDIAHETEEDLATTLRAVVHYVPEVTALNHLYISTVHIESFRIIEDKTYRP